MSFRMVEKPPIATLRHFYVELQMSTHDIAISLGVSKASVRRWLLDYNIPIRPIHAQTELARNKRRKSGLQSWNDQRRQEYSSRLKGKTSTVMGKHWTVNHPIEKRLLRGERNPRWKGGKTKLIIGIRCLGHYSNWRKKIFERDNYTCVLCGTRCIAGNKVYLEADHIKRLSDLIDEYSIQDIEQAIECSALWDLSNGRTLCQSCHEQTDTYGRNQFKR